MHMRSILSSFRLLPGGSQFSIHCSWQQHQKATAVFKNLLGLPLIAVFKNLLGLAMAVTREKFLPLSHLTAQSARIGSWEVMVWDPKDTTHEYLWDGKKKRSNGFRCTLISTNDPKEYVTADSHGKGMTQKKTKRSWQSSSQGLCLP